MPGDVVDAVHDSGDVVRGELVAAQVGCTVGGGGGDQAPLVVGLPVAVSSLGGVDGDTQGLDASP